MTNRLFAKVTLVAAADVTGRVRLVHVTVSVEDITTDVPVPATATTAAVPHATRFQLPVIEVLEVHVTPFVLTATLLELMPTKSPSWEDQASAKSTELYGKVRVVHEIPLVDVRAP